MKNSNNIMGNQTHDLPAYSTVPQLTELLRDPNFYTTYQQRFAD